MTWNTAEDEKPCEYTVRNILIDRCLAPHHLLICIDDCEIPPRSTCNSWMPVAKEKLEHFLQKKYFSGYWSIFLQLVHELFPETPISILYRLAHCTRRRTTFFSFTTPPSIETGKPRQALVICAVVFAWKWCRPKI